jgi:hypothetical protein
VLSGPAMTPLADRAWVFSRRMRTMIPERPYGRLGTNREAAACDAPPTSERLARDEEAGADGSRIIDNVQKDGWPE